MLSQVGGQGRLITPDKRVKFTFVSIIPANARIYPSTTVSKHNLTDVVSNDGSPTVTVSDKCIKICTVLHDLYRDGKCFLHRKRTTFVNKPNCLRFVKEMYLNLDILDNMHFASFDTIVSVH